MAVLENFKREKLDILHEVKDFEEKHLQAMQMASFGNDDQRNDEETITKTLTPLRDNTPQYT